MYIFQNRSRALILGSNERSAHTEFSYGQLKLQYTHGSSDVWAEINESREMEDILA